MTMTDYFNDQKIQYAQELLTTTDYSIENICESIGLVNISYFYELFKRKYNTTPNRYRKNFYKTVNPVLSE